jgi:glycerol-3-phosphate acyltransferase PlsY
MLLAGLFTILSAYILGAIPTAIIAGKLLKKIDIREHGSGNAGATNVFRVLGWRAGLIVLLIDMFKGFVPVFWIAPHLFKTFTPTAEIELQVVFQILAALSAIAGHIWTIFAKFKGGKGVGTSAGVFMGLAPIPLTIALLGFIIIVYFTRYVSLGSILATIIFSVSVFIQRFFFLDRQAVPDILLYLVSIISLLIIWAHRENMKRLAAGNENKLRFGGSD